MVSLSFLLYFLRPLGSCLCVRRLVGVGSIAVFHLLELWFYSHLSVIARGQLVGFVSRNRVQATVVLYLPFSGDVEGWLAMRQFEGV